MGCSISPLAIPLARPADPSALALKHRSTSPIEIPPVLVWADENVSTPNVDLIVFKELRIEN